MTSTPIRCLVLACGNTLRSDDGAGPLMAAWAEQRFRNEPGVRIIACQQWTLDLAADIAEAESVLFLDCSIATAAGEVQLAPVHPVLRQASAGTHHLGADELLALSSELFNSLPREALLLTIGAGSTELGEQFSEAVAAVLPQACRVLEDAIQRLIG